MKWRAVLAAAAVCLCTSLAAHDGVSLPSPELASATRIFEHGSGRLAIFDYDAQANTLVLDFPTLNEQGSMFNRIVTFIEKRGAPRDRVLDDEELRAFIRSTGKTETTLAFGNDFRVAQLVVFFNHAELNHIELNGHESALLALLQQRQWIVRRNGFYHAELPGAVVLSLPQRHPGARGHPPVTSLARRTILLHELSHSEFFTNAGYADYARRFWKDGLTEAQRVAFRNFLAKSGYDPDDGEITVNEVQAYLMHTPDPAAFAPSMLGMREREVAELRQKFLAGKPPTVLFESTADLR